MGMKRPQELKMDLYRVHADCASLAGCAVKTAVSCVASSLFVGAAEAPMVLNATFTVFPEDMSAVGSPVRDFAGLQVGSDGSAGSVGPVGIEWPGPPPLPCLFPRRRRIFGLMPGPVSRNVPLPDPKPSPILISTPPGIGCTVEEEGLRYSDTSGAVPVRNFGVSRSEVENKNVGDEFENIMKRNFGTEYGSCGIAEDVDCLLMVVTDVFFIKSERLRMKNKCGSAFARENGDSGLSVSVRNRYPESYLVRLEKPIEDECDNSCLKIYSLNDIQIMPEMRRFREYVYTDANTRRRPSILAMEQRTGMGTCLKQAVNNGHIDENDIQLRLFSHRRPKRIK